MSMAFDLIQSYFKTNFTVLEISFIIIIVQKICIVNTHNEVSIPIIQDDTL